ncbi:MAG TPA: aminoglycoside phosphotransferase family protein [bacterium]
MNLVLDFLSQNCQRLGLQANNPPAQLTSVVATPRFQASAHLIFFVLKSSNPTPFLVVKVPRLPGDHARLDREAANLRAIHAVRTGGFDSIPKVLAYEDYRGSRLLVETALAFPTMRPSLVRRQPQVCTQALLDWLLELHSASLPGGGKPGWFADLVAKPLNELESCLLLSNSERSWLEQTREICQPISDFALPLVVEHGDLSSPNILMNERSQVGVVDWELALPAGLPAVDLFFFLTYIAFSLQKARKTAEYVSAFGDAFFGKRAWATPHVLRYAEVLQISSPTLKPLFLLCWVRYINGLVQRLKQPQDAKTQLSTDQVNWLRSNRFYAWWTYALDHLNDVAF